MLVSIIGHFLAVAIGITLGLMGGGGSMLAIPVLIYVIGLDAKEAIAMSFVMVGIVSLIGLIPHWLQGNVNFKVAIIFTPPAMLGAFFRGTSSFTGTDYRYYSTDCFCYNDASCQYVNDLGSAQSVAEQITKFTSKSWVGDDVGRVRGRNYNRFCRYWWGICDYSSLGAFGWNSDEGSDRYIVTDYCF